MERSGRNQKEIAEAGDVQRSQLSRILKGQLTMTPDALGRIHRAFENDPAAGAELIKAYLADEIEEAGVSRKVTVRVDETETELERIIRQLPVLLQQDLVLILGEIIAGDEFLSKDIHHLASRIRQYRPPHSGIRLVAEDPAPFAPVPHRPDKATGATPPERPSRTKRRAGGDTARTQGA